MGLGALNNAVDGTPIPAADNNAIVAALKQDLVPRNSSAVAEADAGRLGTSTYPWDRANITTGYFVCGDVKMFHDFNGLISPGHGWMKCNGGQVTEVAYNAIHGAGMWDEYIVSSPIENKFLPNMNNKFPVGATNTTQDGSIAITSEGNAAHQVNLQHTHTGPSHNHQWMEYDGSGQDMSTFQSDGAATGDVMTATFQTGGSGRALNVGDYYTSNAGTGNTGNGGSTAQDIKPEAIALEFWMRII